ncbi:MAG: hypothetical protein DHS20C18_37350 [Saprospiraceae bacterium]|nr:MAG: hypothetical protein DHS20C18_37350 [Saprospiraceae bacterium]
MSSGDNLDLSGYDMIVSLNQEEIYAGIEDLFANPQAVLGTPWIVPADADTYQNGDAATKEAMSRIEIDSWWAPYPVFKDSDAAHSEVTVYFLIKSGYLLFWKMGAESWDPNTPVYLPLDNWAIRFDVNMNLVEAAKTYGVNTPQSVTDQLTKFQENMFKVNTLLMDFNNNDLMENTWAFIPPCQIPADKWASTLPKTIHNTPVEKANWQQDSTSSIATQQLTGIMKNFLTQLKASNNPYIFGYTAKSDNEPTVETASFVPTGTSFSTTMVTPDTYGEDTAPACLTYPMVGTDTNPNPGKLNTLNYLLMTNNKDVAEGHGGVFPNSWVRQGQHGAMVISEMLIWKLIAKGLADGSSQIPYSAFNEGYYKAKTSDPGLGEVAYLAINPNYDGGDNIENASMGTYIVIKGDSQQIDVHFTISGQVPLKIWQSLFGGVKVDSVTATVTQTMTIVFSNPTKAGTKVDPIMTPTVSYSDPNIDYENNVGIGFEKAAIAALDAATGDWKDAISEIVDAIKGTVNFSSGFSELDQGLQDLHAKIVLPAGKEFYFKNAKFAPHRMLVVDLNYKD